jgi:uridine kinase
VKKTASNLDYRQAYRSMNLQPKLVAIVGGSGSGKTWLADRLQQSFGRRAARLSLDDFYQDFSNFPSSRRTSLNFDNPRAIDWARWESALRACRSGRSFTVPRYDFATHTRYGSGQRWSPQRLVFVDGLWLLYRPELRGMFDLTIFVACPTELRLERRLSRDVAERERTPDSVREQFWATVAPMHDRYVAPQQRWAEIVVNQPPAEKEIENLLTRICSLL